jgi:hypothetical protein
LEDGADWHGRLSVASSSVQTMQSACDFTTFVAPVGYRHVFVLLPITLPRRHRTG